MENIIEVKNLKILYGDNVAIEDINLNIPKGVRAAIVGPNGAGKSTLLKGILGLVKRNLGEVKIFDKDIKQVSKNIAYVPQKGSVNWDFPTTVFDVVLMGRYAYLPIGKRPSNKDKEIAIAAIKEMGLEKFKDRQISELSGGQKQRVFIARALTQDVDLYILDEPFAGIDINTEKLIVQKFINLQKQGKTIITVHHNLNTLLEYFDYVVIINKTLRESGFINSVDIDKKIKEAYRG